LPRAGRDRARGGGFTLKEGRFRLEIRMKVFPVSVVRPWARLPREAVAVPSLAGLKARLDGAGSKLVAHIPIPSELGFCTSPSSNCSGMRDRQLTPHRQQSAMIIAVVSKQMRSF